MRRDFTRRRVHAYLGPSCRDVHSLARFAERLSSSQRQVDEATLIADIQACARDLGRTPGSNAFDNWLGFGGSQLALIRFGSWSQACRAAGLEPHRRPAGCGLRKYDNAMVRAAYERIRELAGGPPSVAKWADLRRESEPTSHCLRRRYGNSWMRFVVEMEALCGE